MFKYVQSLDEETPLGLFDYYSGNVSCVLYSLVTPRLDGGTSSIRYTYLWVDDDSVVKQPGVGPGSVCDSRQFIFILKEEIFKEWIWIKFIQTFLQSSKET